MSAGARIAVVLLAGLAVLAAPPTSAPAASAPDRGIPFEPRPVSEPVYGIAPPGADPARQKAFVRAADGTELFVEAWLPTSTRGHPPLPRRLPVVLHLSPYLTEDEPQAPIWERAVRSGYAYVQAHVRGSGRSGGCIEQTGATEQDDGARIVEWLGTTAPWSDGNVGMTGQSYPGGTQVAVASGPDRRRLRFLRAIAPQASVASLYDFYHQDGVPDAVQAPASSLAYFGDLSHPTADLSRLGDRPGCQPEVLAATLRSSVDGAFTPFYEERDHRRNAGRITAATLAVHGHIDRRVPSLEMAGFFDRLPARTPRAGVFGMWDHEDPDTYDFNGELTEASPRRDWERADWQAVLIAWFDRWLKGLDSGVDGWPTVQVQGTDGQWRAEDDWPHPDGPAGQLALAPGQLGATAPGGSTDWVSAPVFELEENGSTLMRGAGVVFSTPPLDGRLELTGQPVLELPLIVQDPRLNVSARLETLTPDGRRETLESRMVGARAVAFRDPLRDDRFVQATARPAPVGRPIDVRIRFSPGDLVVPRGHVLRLTVAASSIRYDGLDGVQDGAGGPVQGPTQPSPQPSPVRILHTCERPAVLRFTMPEPAARLLNVRERDEGRGPLASTPEARVGVDGGGLAGRAVCGRSPTPPDPGSTGRAVVRPAPSLVVGRRAVLHRGRRLRVAVRCPASERTGCAPLARGTVRSGRRVVRLPAHARVVPAGRRARLTWRLSRRADRLLRRTSTRPRAHVRVVARAVGRPERTTRRRLAVRVPRRR